jgi:hypothetical protein
MYFSQLSTKKEKLSNIIWFLVAQIWHLSAYFAKQSQIQIVKVT